MVFIKRIILLICILIFGLTSIFSIANTETVNNCKKEVNNCNNKNKENKKENKENKDVVSSCILNRKQKSEVLKNKRKTEAKDDMEISMNNKKEVSEKISLDKYDAINKDVDVPKKKKTSSSSKTVNGYSYKKKLRGSVTAYTAKSGARTSTGRKAAYGVVAVNPKIIPYGTKLYIPGYGTAVAGDTGGALMKGTALVDVFYPTYKQCNQWGRQNVDVYILK